MDGVIIRKLNFIKIIYYVINHLKLIYFLIKTKMNEIKNLGEDQWKWLNKFKSINLQHWRIIGFPGCNPPLWLYVGEWQPNKSKLYDGYDERLKNLKSNRYYYWPS